MLNRLLSNLQFQGQALSLRAERQSVLASNIANTDTPNYKARDFDFASQLAKATGTSLPQAAGGSAAAGGAGGAASAPAGSSTLALAASMGGAAAGAAAGSGPLALDGSDGRHLAGNTGAQTYSSRDAAMQYRTPDQASMDGNTVELDRERANFADNAVHYEATLRFINGNVRTILSAIRGE